jgi:Bacterial Ig-like domain
MWMRTALPSGASGVARVVGVPVFSIVAALSGCSDDESTTELDTEGPPMVRQVFVQEKEPTGGGGTLERFRLAFGDHPDIPTREEDSLGDDRVVENAVAFADDAKIRVVLDELLVGNHIEELQCADGSFSRVPVGTDPDDIARCSGPDLSGCEAVCIGPGGPIGINDQNRDGAVDPGGLRMIDYGDGELAVSVVCDGEPMPLIAQVGTGNKRSFYNPSGNQLIPADTGVEGLGPALVLFPTLGLKAGSSCGLRFRPEVVDRDGNRVCAPPDGDVSQDCPGEGDTSAIQFQVEPFALRGSEPDAGDVVTATSGTDQTIFLEFVTDVDPATLDGITLSTGGDEVAIAAAPGSLGYQVVVTVVDGYQPGRAYSLRVDTGVTDLLGGGPAEPLAIDFTTADAAASGRQP